MWICSGLGYYSIVEKMPGMYHIRARRKDDLKNLQVATSLPPEIFETPNADYRYRTIVDAKGLMRVMLALMESVDYTNFKDSLYYTDQEDKLDAYHKVWSEMMDYQDEIHRRPEFLIVGDEVELYKGKAGRGVVTEIKGDKAYVDWKGSKGRPQPVSMKKLVRIREDLDQAFESYKGQFDENMEGSFGTTALPNDLDWPEVDPGEEPEEE